MKPIDCSKIIFYLTLTKIYEKYTLKTASTEQMTLKEASNEGSACTFRLYLWSHLHEAARNCPFRNEINSCRVATHSE